MPELEESGRSPCLKQTKLVQPIFLYLQDGRPVTDKDGRPLLNIAGNHMISTVTGPTSVRYEDVKGQYLTDAFSRTPEDPGYDPTKCPSFKILKRICQTQVFALDGHPLTDPDGVPLNGINGKSLLTFNPKGHPLTDVDGRDVTDKFGNILNLNEKPYLSKNKVPLRIFDNLGRPLTDENGYPLTNILNESLIINDEFRNPIGTLDGYSVKDAESKDRWEEGYDLTKIPKYNKINKMIICKNNEPGIAFDQRGHPLTDMNGFPLFDLDGIALVKKRKVWMDKFKNPVTLVRKSVYDKDEVSTLKNSQGVAVKIYDKRGWPLTDHNGTPLRNALGYVLLKFNENGEPISDNYGETFYDCKGNELGSAEFSPCRQYEKNPNLEKALSIKSNGVQFFDRRGMPVTNGEGIPLVNAQQQLLAVFDAEGVPIRDLRGHDIYDISGLPIVQYLDKPLTGPNGLPIRLYNKSGRPLVDRCGFTLKSIKNQHLLKLNKLHQIVSDYKDGPIYDMEGNPVTFINSFFATKYPFNEDNAKTLVKLDNAPLLIFNLYGEPLTDCCGHILYDSFGSPLITCSENGNIFDSEGNEVLDLEGFNCMQVAGRCLREKLALYDEYDRPLIGSNGYVLRTRLGKEMVQFDYHGFPIATYNGRKVYDSHGVPLSESSNQSEIPIFEEIIVFNGKISLYDCDDLPLLDINGAVLMTSRGVPLLQLDEDNNPRSDCFGRPIFDKRGIPVSNPGGIWKNSKGIPFRLYDENGKPLTDPRGKELLDINNKPLIIRDSFGHPKYDIRGQMVRDANGRVFADSKFDGLLSPLQGKSVPLYDYPGKPLRLYDYEERPLTDECGKPLETAKGKPLLNTSRGLKNIRDFMGRIVFDHHKMPLSCKPSSPILSINGKPMLLYSEEGSPLTTEEGLPIQCLDGHLVLEFDEYGRPIGPGNSALYDSQGNSYDSPSCCLDYKVIKQSVSFMSLEGRPVRIFDEGGRPITDNKGNVLFQSDGTPLKAGSWGDTPTQENLSVT